MVSALYVQDLGVYFGRPDVDPWPEARDARTYAGPYPVVAHPPCGPWGRYAKPTPESSARGPLLGDDGGCFLAALRSVRAFGGVLEHPQDSKAWARYGLPTPPPRWWARTICGGWVCLVEQGHYGHVARKPTWLYCASVTEPPDLIWGESDPPPIGTGARRGNLESLSKRKRAATPPGFADVLIQIARSCA